MAMAVASSINHLTDLAAQAQKEGWYAGESESLGNSDVEDEEEGNLLPKKKVRRSPLNSIKDLRVLVVELLLLLLDRNAETTEDLNLDAIIPLEGWAWKKLLLLLKTSSAHSVCVRVRPKGAINQACIDLAPRGPFDNRNKELKHRVHPEFYFVRANGVVLKDDNTGMSSQEDKRANEGNFKKFANSCHAGAQGDHVNDASEGWRL